MLKLSNCSFNIKRQEYHYHTGKIFKTSYELMSSFDRPNYLNLRTAIATSFINGTIDSANKEELIEIPFVSKDNNCVESVSKVILDYFGFDYSLQEISYELKSKGYNELYGHDANIDGGIIAIDNIINYIANQSYDAQNIRITNISQIFSNLGSGILVPIRVKNSIYYNNPNMTGGRYVILFAVIEGQALVIDFNADTKIRFIDITHLFNSILANEDSICVWDLSPCYCN